MKFSLKIHTSYRTVVAICDAEVLGKKFEEGVKQLDIAERFYKGDEINEEAAIQILQSQNREDATFNIVGNNAVALAIKAGIINEGDSAKIQDVAYALKLL